MATDPFGDTGEVESEETKLPTDHCAVHGCAIDERGECELCEAAAGRQEMIVEAGMSAVAMGGDPYAAMNEERRKLSDLPR
jgi:hypothetical protein